LGGLSAEIKESGQTAVSTTYPMGFLQSILAAIFDPSNENRNTLRGASGEAQGNLGLFLFLPAEYVVLSNVTLPTPGGTTQIDHVVVSQYGVHVIESKNIKGSIYGAVDQERWTVFLGKKKYQLYNPLLQNRAHIKALSAALRLPESTFHSIVFFWSDYCRFKTEMPANVMTEGLCTYIKSRINPLIAPQEVMNVVKAINNARLPENDATAQAHVAQLKERFHTRHQAGDPCPQCSGGRLVQRTSRTTGNSFLGCSKFPHCRYTERPQN